MQSHPPTGGRESVWQLAAIRIFSSSLPGVYILFVGRKQTVCCLGDRRFVLPRCPDLYTFCNAITQQKPLNKQFKGFYYVVVLQFSLIFSLHYSSPIVKRY